MIEFDYLITRRDGDHEEKFAPAGIPQRLDNLVYIEGPNSSGKSTLLNIIALGLHGLRNKRINSALTEKLKSLCVADHQKISFKLRISNKDDSLALLAEKSNKDNPEIDLFEVSSDGKKRMTPELFEKKYNLIYDIPDNPTQRLHHLILDLKESQILYGNNIGMLKQDLRRIIGEIKEARDPGRIKTLEGELDEIGERKKSSALNGEKLEKQVNLIEEYTYERFYREYKEKCDMFQEDLKGLEKQERRVKIGKERTVVKINSTVKEAKETMREMEEIFASVGSSLKTTLKEKSFLKIYEKINLRQALTDLEFDDRLKECISQFKIDLHQQQSTLSQSDSSKESEVVQALLHVLDRFKGFKGELPGFGKSVQEFISALEIAAEKHEDVLARKEEIRLAEEDLERLDVLRMVFQKELFPKLRTIKKIDPAKDEPQEEETSIEDDKADIVTKLEKCQRAFEYYDALYAKKGKPSAQEIRTRAGRDWNAYEAFKEEQLKRAIDDWRGKLAGVISDQKGLENTYLLLSHELDRLKSKKPHQYQNDIEELKVLFDKVNSLDAKVRGSYCDYIEQIIRKQIPHQPSAEQKAYNDAVFSFLGARLGKFFHIHDEYTATKVDLAKGTIHTKEGKLIHLTDMGTGQSQSAYLKGLLNSSDKRKIIAMFDEVAMMDSRSLEPIYKKFRELYDSGKLLAGIVVQRGEKIKATSIVE